MRNIMKSVLIGVTIATSLAMTAVPAFAYTFPPITPLTIPNGSVIFGNSESYSLDYANTPANLSAIQYSVVNSAGKIWVKEFDGTIVDNNTGKPVSTSTLPSVIEYYPPMAM